MKKIFILSALCVTVLCSNPVFAQGYDGLISAPAAPRGGAAPAANNRAPADIYSMIQGTAPRVTTRGRVGYSERLKENAVRRNQEIAEKNAGFKKATEDSFAPAKAALDQEIAQNNARVSQILQNRGVVRGQQPLGGAGVLAPAPTAQQPTGGGGSSVLAPPTNRQEYQSPY